MVLIQGVGVAGGAWQPQVDALASNFACLWFDNRGFGSSLPMGGLLTVELMAEDVLALMKAQGWQSAHLVGHSLGGLIALHVARLAPQRVRSLSLLCTFATGAIPTRMTPWIMAMGIRTRVGSLQSRRRAFLNMVMPSSELRGIDRDAYAQRLGTLFGHDLALQPPIVMHQLRAMRRADARPFLPAFGDIPTLVVSAAHDRIAPAYGGRALAGAIPGARYVEIEGASHGVTIHQPERINGLLMEHLLAAERTGLSLM